MLPEPGVRPTLVPQAAEGVGVGPLMEPPGPWTPQAAALWGTMPGPAARPSLPPPGEEVPHLTALTEQEESFHLSKLLLLTREWSGSTRLFLPLVRVAFSVVHFPDTMR